MQRSRLALSLAAFIASTAATHAAPTDVRLEPKQIEAARLLLQVEDTSLLLDGLAGHFLPGPTLRHLGAAPADFPIDLGSTGDLADVRFSELRARGIELALENGRLRVEIPFVDREKAIRTKVGAIHFRGVRAVAWLKPVESLVGTLSLVEDGAELRGELKGTGLIGAGVISKLRSTVAEQVRKQITAFLSKPGIAEKLEHGDVTYAQFSQDPLLQRYVTGTLKVSTTAITYQAE
jgi:hypothetical protein